ncbi:uncharacterized protein PHACADRAFT_205018 [Phanerochaete carnosa HHB-10118-sp]|uniref:E3 ubiquitin-protein ligase PEP5 n=1 Tax=Phanerochaete carnosa (strain HHB-10118-sp) TaxID=650164 RepID=K5VFV0_PHACS|nr:uncharacterized protein PHACADRAFT_205018 [Phanerochaete carnosa HHB-10118-sp]EKM61891.1 hypothetical protein PHACADRAFT_205018 [Phanerochaete carnosa HHB-10118-sp]
MSTHSATPAASAWRQFNFFDITPVKDVHDLASSPEIFKKTPEISCITSTQHGTIVADIHGSVYRLNEDFETVNAWVAHTGGRVTHMLERSGLLVTIGEEDTARHPLLKIWDLQTTEKKSGAPVLLRSAKVQSGNRPHPVSTIALTASLSHLAIGLADGTVLLYRHLDQSIFNGSTSLTALPKARVVLEGSSDPVTGLGFRESNRDNLDIHLFIVTTNRVLMYQVSGKGHGGTPTAVDEVGCALGCATMDHGAREIVVARDEAIYLCGIEGRGACYAYEGHKSAVYAHRNYLVIVSPPFTPTASAPSATVRNFVRDNDIGAEISRVVVFDLENKFVAYSGTYTDGIRDIFAASGQIYLLSNDGKLLRLEEKPTPEKLELLYRKSQYLLALSLAKTQGLDEQNVADIRKQYGDHLYAKGEYDSAMQQFVQTISYVQPSYVVRKFLDAQRIHNLVMYLQELHNRGLANADHTTLLLNTYTKLKDVTRLDSFIKSESRRTSADSDADELPFDLDTAIRVCRQAGYFEHASYLAEKYERHEDYLQIMVEDAGNYREALTYLRRLGTEAAEGNLARYGRALLDNLPEETTALLIDLCTSLTPLAINDEDSPPASARQSSVGGPSYLSYLALNRGSAASASSETAQPSTASTTTTVKAPAPRRQGSVNVSDASPSSQPSRTATPTVAKSARHQVIKRPSPRVYFAHFIDHPVNFLNFLEQVALLRWGRSVNSKEGVPTVVESDLNADPEVERRDQAAVWNTLLELYLVDTPDKALRVLQRDDLPYDHTHALILCSTRGFTPGLVLLWEKLGMFEDVLRFHMDREREDPTSGGSKDVIHCLDKYGAQQPGLYPLVLRFLTSSPELLGRHTDDLGRILEHIESEKIMPPLAVVQVLSRNNVASVGLVKQWLLSRIKSARAEIDMDQKLIDSYRTETKAKLKQVEDLSDPEHPRVFHVTQCSACGGQLDLPSLHFMCNHSYHQRCLGEHETECPNCARQRSIIREIRRNNVRLADQHDVFLSEVKEGGYAAVAAGFGRGVLNMSRLEEIAS